MSVHQAYAKSPEHAELEVEHRWPGVSCDAEYDQGDFVVTIVPLASENAVELSEAVSGRSPKDFHGAIAELARILLSWASRPTTLRLVPGENWLARLSGDDPPAVPFTAKDERGRLFVIGSAQELPPSGLRNLRIAQFPEGYDQKRPARLTILRHS